MKIGIDITSLKTLHKNRGIGVYTQRLINTLKLVDKKNEYICFSRGQKLPDVDIIHYPYFDLFFLTLPLFKKRPTVVTVYDVTPLIFWQYFKPGFRAKLKLEFQKLSLRNTAAIITVSNCSKTDIKKYLGIEDNKITVTYLAAYECFKPINTSSKLTQVKNKYKLPDNFVLYVGDVNYNKNLPNLVKAMVNIPVPLVIVGEAARNDNLIEVKNLMELAVKLRIENKIFRIGFVPDSELALIYNLATCYVQPSFYEGFGLPVLEAMACGLPVACSNASSLPEVGGDAAIYFNPQSVDDIVKSVMRIIGYKMKNREKYNELSKKGIMQAAKFTWRKTAEQTVLVYDKAIGSKS